MENRIILIGFMGSGKSHFGKLIAQHFDVSFADLDDIIEETSGMSINEIFMHAGERYFRKLERKAIINLYKEKVVATGAGVVETEQNREWLKESSNYVVWLNYPWEKLWDRIRSSDRPKARSLNQDDLYALWERRVPLYDECADLVYHKEDESELIDMLQDKLSE